MHEKEWLTRKGELKHIVILEGLKSKRSLDLLFTLAIFIAALCSREEPYYGWAKVFNFSFEISPKQLKRQL